MEELFLGTLFLGEELNVIDQQRIHRTVKALELVDGIQLQGLDHVRHKTLGMQVNHLGIRVFLQQMITHRMHQVGFTQAHAAVQKQRVVAMLGVIGHLPGCRSGQLVGFTFDKVFEGKGAIQITGVLEPAFDLHRTLGTRGLNRCIGATHRVKANARRLIAGHRGRGRIARRRRDVCRRDRVDRRGGCCGPCGSTALAAY